MDFLLEWNSLYWLFLGFILLIAEIFIPGVFLMWWGFAGVIVAGLTYFMPQIAMSIQLVIFASIASICCFFWWRYMQRKSSEESLEDKNLNARDKAMIGNSGKVTEVLGNSIGRAKFGDTTWRIEGENLEVDQIVIVYDVKGITLHVKQQ